MITKSTEVKPYETIKMTDLLVGPTDIEWTVDPFIPPGASTLLAGYSGSGKTWLALRLAIDIASGRQWLGRFPVKQGPVLVIDEENAELLLRVRLAKLLRAEDLENETLPIHFLVGKCVNLSPTRGKNGLPGITQSFKRLCKTVDEVKPRIVVFDSLTRVHRANENSSNEMAEVFANVRKITDLGTSCVVIHHFRKSGASSGRSGDRIRGSADIRAYFDATLLCDPTDNGCIITPDKLRWTEPKPSFAVNFLHDDDSDAFQISYAGEAGESNNSGKTAINEAWSWLQDILSDGPKTRSELVAKINGSGFSKRTLDEVLSWRHKNDFLDKKPDPKDGRRKVYTLLTDEAIPVVEKTQTTFSFPFGDEE